MYSKFITYLLLLFLALTSCKRNDKDVEYKYATAGEFTWGYAQFYGKYYADYGIENNVVSLSVFTDSLFVNNKEQLAGFGQYIILEDIFSAPTDTLLQEGTYKISDKREPMNATKGEVLEIDGLKYNTGAYIYFIEKNALFSKSEQIIDGKFSLNYSESKYYLLFDFLLSDSSTFKGRVNFKSLPFIDESVNYPSGMPRQKIKFKTEIKTY
jgi:hypothetical protein